MKILNKTLFTLQTFVLLYTAGYHSAIAQNQYAVQRLSDKIIFDGLCNETAWQKIRPLPLVMHIPNFGSQPTERTDILIAYDDNYLYAAGRLYDNEPTKIKSSSKKRDFMGGNSDLFGIVIDTFNDKENGVAFITTPAGLRTDVTVFNDAQAQRNEPINFSWNTFWDVKTKVNEDGWFVEMRIPFSSLRFQEIDGTVVMGLIAWRWIPHKNEQIIFPAIPDKWGWWSAWKPSQAREIVLKGIHSHKPLYVAPYLLGGWGKSFELNEAETTYLGKEKPTLEAGIDIKYGITSNLTMDVTLNTDFAQVEADDQQINLTRFSLFFPEKRLFFQERSSNFDFNLGGPNRLFYSRRIGIHEGKPVRIYGGARIVGRVAAWDVGLLDMQTASVEDLSSENFAVLRLRRRVFNPNSYVGGIYTSRISTTGSYNATYGFDGILRLFGDDYMNFHFAQSFEDSVKNKLTSLSPSRVSFGWERRTIKGLGYRFNLSVSGKDFNPGIGFVLRNDYTRYGTKILYGWTSPEQSRLQRHYVFLDGFVFVRNTEKIVETAEVGPGWDFATKSSSWGKLSANIYYENVVDTFSLSDNVDVPRGKYTFYGIKGFVTSPMGYTFYTMINFDAGSFYDGYRFSLSATPTWSISSDFELSGFYELNRVTFQNRDQFLTAHIGRLKALWMLSTSLSFSAFIQYNSAVDAVITNVRFRYNPQEGNDFYLVYDEGMNTDRRRELPFLPVYSNRTILLKYTYTFNL